MEVFHWMSDSNLMTSDWPVLPWGEMDCLKFGKVAEVCLAEFAFQVVFAVVIVVFVVASAAPVVVVLPFVL